MKQRYAGGKGTRKGLTAVSTVVKHMLADQGLDVNTVVALPLTADGNAIDWTRVEKFLLTLTETERKTFAIGDQEEMHAIANRNVEAALAQVALEELFMEIGG